MVASTQSVYEYSLEHSPTLNTVLMVEETLKNMEESVIKIADLKKRLPKQVNHNTLKIILEYLEVSNKILVTMKGITWIHNTNPNLKKAIKEGFVLSPEAEEVYKYLNERASKSKIERSILNAIEKKKRTNKSKHALRR